VSDTSIKVEGVEALLSLDKQVRFAAARSLTEAAKQSQESSIRAIQQTFTTRSQWFQPSNRYGLRVRAARKDNLEATVGTAADWLALHETAGTKVPRGEFIAIPTSNVRRSKRQIIRRAHRPRNLRRSFLLKTKSGLTVLFQRKGRGRKSDIVAMYVMQPRARIRKESTVTEVAKKVVARRFGSIFDTALREALATAKSSGGREAKGVWAFD
jgi:hypothetical protein